MKKLFCLIMISTCHIFGEQQAVYVKYVECLQKAYIKQLQKTESIHSLSPGGSLFNDINQIGLELELIQEVTVAQARRLYVKYAESFIKMINADRRIRPYLHHYPVTIADLDFSLNFSDCQNRDVRPPYIWSVSSVEKKIYYTLSNIVRVHEETYEEALRIVQKEQSQDR